MRWFQIDRHKAIAKQERDGKEEAVRVLRKLERQKTDLLAAFKKQMRLINILKRQRIHVRECGVLKCHPHACVRTPGLSNMTNMGYASTACARSIRLCVYLNQHQSYAMP